ncbi:MAG: tRNA pseudouridine(13) synthase TruD [Bdellovibrionota bacterium]|nr:tRNA pseudouridine(13) synthase TruD [Bdellovibrionota bacterium]
MKSTLTYLTSEIPGVGGVLKGTPEDFRVMEILPEVKNEGEHVSLECTREGMTTQEVLGTLTSIFSLKNKNSMGHAGLKDKHAKTTQTFSIPLGRTYSLEKVEEKLSQDFPELKVNSLKRREKKIRLGELLGNRFEVIVSELPESVSKSLEKSQLIKQKILKCGFPNYFGPQRFGDKGDNAEKGKEVFLGKKINSPWLKKFLLSAYQSELFNLWLSRRLDEGRFEEICEGDACFKKGDDRPFVFKGESDIAEVNYTGPLFGKKMFWPSGELQNKEEKLWEDEGHSLDRLKDFPLYGGRRPGRVLVPDLKVSEKEEGLLFNMTLPAGSYATSLLREFMK